MSYPRPGLLHEWIYDEDAHLRELELLRKMAGLRPPAEVAAEALAAPMAKMFSPHDHVWRPKGAK